MGERRKSYVQLFYHFVWGTKNREPMINEGIKALLRKFIQEKANELLTQILECDGTADHVHVLVSSPANLAPSDIAKHLKGASSYSVNHEGSSSVLYWQDGYGVISVSPSAVSSVRQYIRNQREHHKTGSLWDEFEYC